MRPSPAAFTALDQWLAWLETLSPREIDLGLERVAAVLERLRLPRHRRVIHVGGTNGKGSCAAMLEALLLRGGHTVGCYTSPHLLRYNERIRVNGAQADDDEILRAFETVESARAGVSLTYFEYGTLAALALFAARRVDTLVLEIGMGGRLDAVNAVEPDAGLITNVALDHCDWLGSDVETIAMEKAGIMRRGKPLVFGSIGMPATIPRQAGEVGADLRAAGKDFIASRDDDSGTWTWRGRERLLEKLPQPSLPGAFQMHNAAAVLALVESLHLYRLLEPGAVSAALRELSLPGRLQWAGQGKWLLDVAHNPHAAAALAASLAALSPPRQISAVIGVLGDKDVDGIVAPLVPVVRRWIAVTPPGARGMPGRELARHIAHLAGKPCLIMDDLSEAMRYADLEEGDNLRLVTGSFYTVGAALRWLEKR